MRSDDKEISNVQSMGARAAPCCSQPIPQPPCATGGKRMRPSRKRLILSCGVLPSDSSSDKAFERDCRKCAYGSLRCCLGSRIADADSEVDEEEGVGAALEAEVTQEGHGVRWAAQAREHGKSPSGVNDENSMTVGLVSMRFIERTECQIRYDQGECIVDKCLDDSAQDNMQGP